MLLLTLELDLNDRLASAVNDGEGEVLHVCLNLGVCKLTTNESLGIEDGVVRVHGDLILCGISDETFSICEGDEGGGCAVALIVGNDFDAIISEDTYARVRSTEIDTWIKMLAIDYETRDKGDYEPIAGPVLMIAVLIEDVRL